MWVKKLFTTSDANVIFANKATVFHRHQLLFLMQEVARCCSEIGEPPGTKLPFEETGEVFLMANDLINIPIPEAETPRDSSLQLILMLLPSMEANLFTNAIQRMARGHLVVTRIADLRQKEGAYFDIRESLLNATGITFEAFEALMAMVFTRLLNVEDVLKDASKFGIDESYFANVPLPPEVIREFFSLVSATPEEYSAALAAQNPRLNDFRVIRDKPLAKIENRYYPLKACCSDENPRQIDGIDMGTISTVMPLLITRDEFGGYMGVNTYLNDRFREIIGKRHWRKSITSLLCVCVNTVEKLSPYLGDTALCELLSVLLRGDKKLSSPFFSELGPFLRRKNGGGEDRRPSMLKEGTTEVGKVAAKVLGLKPTEGTMASTGADNLA